MRQIVSAACGLLLCLAGPTQAQIETEPRMPQSAPGVVVELFTSQGCSACPPADAFFAALAREPDVIPLSLHVDYWDYIGWEDSFGDARFTERQKAYARAIGSRSIYTPQMIVDGLARVEGNRPGEVGDRIRDRLAASRAAAVTLTRTGEAVDIRVEAPVSPAGRLRVEMVRYRPTQTVGIERGENAGLTVTYANVVTDWQSLGEWSGAGAFDLRVPAPGTDPVVVLLQKPGPGEIVAAARLMSDRAGSLPGRPLPVGIAAAATPSNAATGLRNAGAAFRGGEAGAMTMGSKTPSADPDAMGGGAPGKP